MTSILLRQRKLRPSLLALLALLLSFGGSAVGGVSVASAASNAVVSRANGTLDVFRRDPASGQLQTNAWNFSTGWTGWISLGGGLSPETDIGAVSRGSGSIDVFVRGTDDGLYQKSWSSSTGWGAWVSLGGILTGGPTATAWDSSRVDVFVRGTDAALVQKTWLATSGWTGWVNLGGALAAHTGPAATSRVSGDLDVAITGTDGALYVRSFQSGIGWIPWYSKGGQLIGGPGIASQRGARANREDFLGVATSGRVAQMTYLNNGWVGWVDLEGIVPANNAPSGIWWNDGNQQRYDVFVTNSLGSVSQRTWTAAGWGPWTAPADGGVADDVVAVDAGVTLGEIGPVTAADAGALDDGDAAGSPPTASAASFGSRGCRRAVAKMDIKSSFGIKYGSIIHTVRFCWNKAKKKVGYGGDNFIQLTSNIGGDVLQMSLTQGGTSMFYGSWGGGSQGAAHIERRGTLNVCRLVIPGAPCKDYAVQRIVQAHWDGTATNTTPKL